MRSEKPHFPRREREKEHRQRGTGWGPEDRMSLRRRGKVKNKNGPVRVVKTGKSVLTRRAETASTPTTQLLPSPRIFTPPASKRTRVAHQGLPAPSLSPLAMSPCLVMACCFQLACVVLWSLLTVLASAFCPSSGGNGYLPPCQLRCLQTTFVLALVLPHPTGAGQSLVPRHLPCPLQMWTAVRSG